MLKLPTFFIAVKLLQKLWIVGPWSYPVNDSCRMDIMQKDEHHVYCFITQTFTTFYTCVPVLQDRGREKVLDIFNILRRKNKLWEAVKNSRVFLHIPSVLLISGTQETGHANQSGLDI